MPVRSPRRGRSSGRTPLVAAAVLVVLLADGAGRAAAACPPAEVVAPAVIRALEDTSFPGVFAAVVAREQRPAAAMSVRAAEAAAARAEATVTDNGGVATQPFPSASIVKLFLAEGVLHRARAGQLRLRGDDLDLMARMIASSDDAAASQLWVRYDGEGLVREVAVRYGLAGTAPPPVAGQWGRTVTTATDVARFLSLLPMRAHLQDVERLHGWMRSATPRASDGFDQRFGLFGAADGQAAVKQGWMCCVDGRRHLHSVGVLGRTVVVLLSEVHPDIGYRAVQQVLTAAAAEVPAPQRP